MTPPTLPPSSPTQPTTSSRSPSPTRRSRSPSIAATVVDDKPEPRVMIRADTPIQDEQREASTSKATPPTSPKRKLQTTPIKRCSAKLNLRELTPTDDEDEQMVYPPLVRGMKRKRSSEDGGRSPRRLRRTGAVIIDTPSVAPRPLPSRKGKAKEKPRLSPRERLRQECAILARSPDKPFPPRADLIVPGLYISDLYTATSDQTLKALRITHVISLVNGNVLEEHETSHLRSLKRLVLKIYDTPNGDVLLRHLDQTTTFINHAFSTNPRAKVLVHCYAGKSRSPSVVMAYLMSVRRMSLNDAMALVVSRRPIIQPNTGFVRQLKEYEKDLEANRRSRTPETELEASDSDTETELDASFEKDQPGVRDFYVRKISWIVV